MPVHVHMDAEMLDDAKSMACETYKRFSEYPGHYGNDLGSHYLGKIGEMACVQWAENFGNVLRSGLPISRSRQRGGHHLESGRHANHPDRSQELELTPVDAFRQVRSGLTNGAGA